MKLLLYLGCPTSERPDADVLLRSAGFAVRWIDDAKQAFDALEERLVPIVLDLRSPHAIPVAVELRNRRAGVLLIGLEDRLRPGASERARRAGVVHVLERPVAPGKLAAAIWSGNGGGNALEPGDGDLDGVVASSAAMKEALETVRRASLDPTGGVLLSGEPGSGRRFMARALHDLNRQPGGRLVELDCSMPAADLEAALFGAADGSRNVHSPELRRDGVGRRFNGFSLASERASTERVTRGSLAFQALGGSLLLLNIEDMPARLQGRLVRLLRDGEAALPNGGMARGPIRAMACVEPGFESAVHEEGRVRPDLFKRLAVTRIAVPPLRDRREDIPALVEHFLEHVCLLEQLPPRKMSYPALTLLTSLPYHGNARELRSLVGMLVERTPTPVIRLEDVLRYLRLDVAGAPVPACQGTLRDARAHFEQQYIREVLERHHGRIAEAAKSLGIQRTNLYRKMRSLGVVHRSPGNGSRNHAR